MTIEQAICNFCLDKHQRDSLQRNSINLCQICFNKAIKSTCFKVSSPNGDLYQIYLVRKSFQPIESCGSITNIQEDFLGQIDQIQNDQIKSTIGKWMHISFTINKAKQLNEGRINKIRDILHRDKHSLFALQTQIAGQLQKLFHQNVSNRIPSMKVIEEGQQKINIEQTNVLKQTSNLQLQNTLENFIPLKTENSTYNNPTEDDAQDYQNRYSLLTDKNKPLKSKKSVKSIQQQKQNSKSRLNIASDKNVPAFDYFYHQDMLWNWNKGPSINFGGKSSKSDNSIEQQRSQFWSKNSSLKARICAFLVKQGKVSQALLKIVVQNTFQAIQNTNSMNKCIELVSHKFQGVDFDCYLNMLSWQGIQTLKLVKLNLSDQLGEVLLQFLKDRKPCLQSLVLTNNRLSQQFLKSLYGVELQKLKNLYLSKNQIHSSKVRKQLKQMKQRYNLYL